MSSQRLFLVPMAMALALGSLAFNVSNTGPLIPDAPDPDADAGGGIETGPLDGGGLDGPPLESSTCNDSFGQVCAPDGGAGCAGGGGLGGLGGQGGAASAALFAIGTTSVVMTNGAFVVGHGGTGGPGGSGESGDPGQNGGTGSAVSCKGGCPSCNVTMLQPGSAGFGTNGGGGGQGGGGAGGPAYFYVTVSGATVDASAATLGASKNGVPGAGGLPNGPDGSAGVHP